MRVPLIEPLPVVLVLFQVPAAMPSDTLSAVSVQLTCPAQPGRTSVPVTAVWTSGFVCTCPSMQSMSPSNVPVPVAEVGPAINFVRIFRFVNVN